MNNAKNQILSRLETFFQAGAYDGWVHPKWITKDHGADVAALRSLITSGFAEEAPIKTDPGFAVRISDAGRAELNA